MARFTFNMPFKLLRPISMQCVYLVGLIMVSAFTTGCAYHMRSAPNLPFTALATPARPTPIDRLPPSGSTWTEVVKRELGVEGTTGSLTDWKLNLISEDQQRQIASLANDGTVREFRLYYRLKVQLQAPPGSPEVFQPISLEVFRDLPYLESQRLAKELEENKLWMDMETELGQRIADRIIWQTEKFKNSKAP